MGVGQAEPEAAELEPQPGRDAMPPFMKEYDEILQSMCASLLDREDALQSWTRATQYVDHQATIGRSHGNKKVDVSLLAIPPLC